MSSATKSHRDLSSPGSKNGYCVMKYHSVIYVYPGNGPGNSNSTAAVIETHGQGVFYGAGILGEGWEGGESINVCICPKRSGTHNTTDTLLTHARNTETCQGEISSRLPDAKDKKANQVA